MDASGYEVLIVDDIPENLQLLTAIFTDRGYRVRQASGGRLALRSLEIKAPDLVLLDINMPEMDGYEVCERIKSGERTRNIPVIFISALHDASEKVKGFEAGGVDYITKPFEPTEVLARAATHIRMRELTERLEQKVDEATHELSTANQQLREALAERDALLKEVHHRVKNNLQIICSLLDLQSDSIPDERSRIYFRSSQDRIRSMALAHEQLYRSRDFASIDIADYIEILVNYLFYSHVSDSGRISLRVDAESVLLGIDASIPCGLIINELVSNALKHAFPDGGEGEITIGLSTGPDGWITLCVMDTGVGFPPGTDLAGSPTLGLQLVGMLVKQLKGEIKLQNDNGASCTVRFRRSHDGEDFRDDGPARREVPA